MMMNRMARKLLQGAVLVAIAASVPTAWADGVKGVQVNNVAAGSAAFSRAGNIMTVRTGTPRTIINYQKLSIASGETLQFLQPSSKSRVLNRIQGNEPTVIDGTVSSNGKVYFVNPAGVMFGEGSIINAGGVIAAAGHISDANFLAGVNHFTGNSGVVTNYGVIHASEIHLVGASVANFGQILTTGSGVVTMTAGDDVYIGETDSPTGGTGVLVKVSSDNSAAKDGTGVTNSGTIDAGGGAISMGAGDLYAAGIYNNGSLRAANITSNAGASTNVNEGRIDASSATGKGGNIQITGDKVGLFAGSVDASGKTGGGSIKIGGDFHGAAGTPASTMTVVGPTATIRADATDTGNGGQVAIWSDQVTEFSGFVSARGGALGGNGGFVEVSGKQNLAFAGGADVGAPAGLAGTLLFDPQNIVINAAGPDNAVLTSTFNTTGNHDYTFSTAALQALTGAVSLTAADNIDVKSSLNFVGSGVTSFTLNATGGDINIDGGVKIESSTQPLTLNAGGTIFMGDAGGVASAEIKTTTGAVLLQAGVDITLQASNSDAFAAKITTSGAPVSLLAAGSILLDSGTNGATSITTGGGALTIRAGEDLTIEGNNSSAHVNLSSTGSGTGGAILLAAGDIPLGGPAAAGTTDIGNNVTVDSGGGNLTFRTTGLNFGPNNQVFAAGTGTVAFETNNPLNTIGIGSGAGTLTLTNANLADVFSAGLIRIGANGVQSGLVTAKNVSLVGFPLEINANAGAGALAIDDNGATGISVTGNLLIRAGTGGITVTQASNNNPEITLSSAGTTLTLVSGAGIGLTTNRLGIFGSAGEVDVTANGNVFLTSLGTGGITFGTISNAGHNIDVISGADINATGTLTAANLLLNASGGIGTSSPLALNLSGAGTLTSHGDNAAGNIHILATQTTLGAITFFNTGSGTQVDTIDSAGNLTLTGGVTGPAADSLVINASGSLSAPGVTISALTLTLHSGTTGTGNLNVSGANLTADNITLVAGNGSGSGAITATGAVFAGMTAAEPASVTLEQDLGLADIPGAGSTSALTVLSHTGTVGISTSHTLGSLAATGTTIVLSSNVTVAGAMNLNGPLLLAGDSVLTGATSLTITGLIASPAHHSLTTQFNGLTTLSAGFEPTPGSELHIFTVNPAGGTITIGTGASAAIRTTSDIFIGEALLLNGPLTVTSTSGGEVEFGGTIDSATSTHSPLVVNATGTTSFDGDVGVATPLGGVTILGGGAVTLGNAAPFTMTVGSPILFSGPVTLGNDATLNASGGTTGSVTFQSTVKSAASQLFSLTVNASDAVTFTGDVGDVATGTLGTFDVTGSAIIFGDGVSPHEVAVVGHQTLNGPITLLSDMTFASLDDISFNGIISAGSASHTSLTVAASGNITLQKGTTTATGSLLQSISIGSFGTTRTGGTGPVTIETIGSQTYDNQVVLLDNTIFEVTGAASTLSFQHAGVALQAGGFDLTLISNSMAFGGTVTGTGHATLQPLATTDNILIQGATGTGANTLILAAGQMALFNGFSLLTLGYPGGSGTVTVSSPVTFGSSTLIQSPSGGSMVVSSAIASLGDLTLHANTIGLGASLSTNGGAITVQGVINLTGAVTLQSHGTAGSAGNITIIGTVDGARVLSLLANGPGGNGSIDLQGVVGGITPLTGLNVSGGTFTVHNNITTAGPINLGNTQTLLATGTGGTTTFAIVSGGGAIHITSPLDATGGGTANLNVSSSAAGAAGAVTLGNIGGLTPLNNLTVDATGATGGLITLPGNIHVTGTVSLTGAGVTESSSGTIQASLLLLQGTGTFSLGNANQVATLAANVTGPLTFGSVSDLLVGTVGLTSGIDTHGSPLTLNASGHVLTAGAPILAGATSLTAASVIINGGLVTSGTAGILTSTGATTFNSSVSATSIIVVGDAFVNANLTATTGNIDFRASSTINGNMTAGGNVLLGSLATDITSFSGNHFITATGNIIVSGPSVLVGGGGPTVLTAGGAGGIVLNGSLSGAHSLRALATGGPILVNGPISLSGSGSTTLAAVTSVTASGSITSSQNLIMNASGGNLLATNTIVLTGTGNSSFTSGSAAGVGVSGGITSSQTLTFVGGSLALAGALVLTGSGTSTLTAGGAGGVLLGNGLTSSQLLRIQANAGAIVIDGPIVLTGSGSTTLAAFTSLTASGSIASSQNLIMNASGGNILATDTIVLTGTGNSAFTSASAAGISVAGNITSSQTLTFVGGSLDLAGALSLTGSGTSTLTAGGAGGIVLGGGLTSSQQLRILASAGAILVDGPIILTGSGSTTLAAFTSLTASGSIASSQNLIMNASGGNLRATDTVVLTGTGNSSFTSASAAGVEVAGNITSSQTLTFVGGSIALAGALLLTGAGTSTLTAGGAGGIAFGNGVTSSQLLRLSSTAGGIVVNGPIVLTGSGSTTLTSFTGITASGSIASSQTLIMNAGGQILATSTISLTGTGNTSLTTTSAGGIEVDGDLASSQTLTMVANSGSISLGGALALTGVGTTTLTAGGIGGITVTGQITGSQALTMVTNHSAGGMSLGPIGTSSTNRYTGTVTLVANTASNVNGVTLNGNIFVGGIVFDGSHPTIPTVATIVSPGNLVIDAASLIDMRANQKLTVLGSLTLRSHAAPTLVGIFVSDIGALGTIVIDAGANSGGGANGLGRVNIRLRTSQSELGHTGTGLSPDGGVDLISYSPTTVSALDAGFGAGNTTIAIRGNLSVIGVPGPVNIASTKVQVVSATANVDITKSNNGDANPILLFPPDQGGVLTTNHGVPILPRIIIAGDPLNTQAGDISNISKRLNQILGSDLTIAAGPLTGTIQDLVPTGTTGDTPTPSAQAALIPQDVQTLFPERGEAISGALAEALQQLGIYARALDSDELVDELLGRGMYNDTLRVLTPVDSSHTVAVNRLPSVPVLPVVEAARALMYREERDSAGNVKMVSKTDEVAAAIGLGWQAFLDEKAAKTPPEEPKPAEFRAYLEQHEKDDAKFATALAYINQIRDLLAQIKLLGLTPTEYDVSRRVIMNKMRDKDRIDERDFAVMIDGPSSRTGGKVAVEVPAPKPADAPAAK